MLADHHHVLVTELASWARSLWEGGGLFGQLQAHHLGGFPTKRQWRLPREDEGLTAYLDGNHSAARARLFQKATGDLKPVDVANLKDRFCADFTPLVEDRHARVHVYERSAPMTAKMLDAREVGVLIEAAARMLNDLSLVALGSTHEKSELNFVNTEDNAEDLSDEVLIGTRIRQRIVMAGLDRNAYYEALHRFHDAAYGVECFNDMSVEDAVQKERGET